MRTIRRVHAMHEVGWNRCIAAAAALLLLGVVEASACNVPVFRYALERWRPDTYEVLVYHRGEQAGEAAAAIERLNDAIDRGYNVTLERVNLDEQPDERQQAIFDAQSSPELPWMVVRYPAMLRVEKDVWSGKLSTAAVDTLLDSPVRQELAKRILAGETAVWLLLESGNPEQDAAARERIEKEIDRLTKELKLPELTDSPDDEINTSGPPLKVAFSVLAISRSDEREALLRSMLVGSEPDLAELSDPMAFPVFGRGRVLFGLIGAGITAENITDSASFLVGPCSCQVKELNPGFDLVMANRWDEIVGNSPLSEPPAPSEPGQEVPIPPGVVEESPQSPAPGDPATVQPVVAKRVPLTAQTAPAAAFSWAKILIVFVGGGLLLVTVVLSIFAVASNSRTRDTP